MHSQGKALRFSQIVQVASSLGVALCIGAFFWTLIATRVNLNPAGRLYVAALSAIALAGVVSGTFAQTKARGLGLEQYRAFVLGPEPSGQNERSAWRWGRIALNCWIAVMIGLLVFGLGLQAAFRS